MNAWVLAARPRTLSAAVVPVLVGAACAWESGVLRLGPALAALVGALFIQIGTNLANDVFDHDKGADTAERLGPVRAVQAGLLGASQVRRGMWISFGLAALSGVYLIGVAGAVVAWIGLASIASGLAYTGGPLPLGYIGLGDLFVLGFFGFVAVCGTSLVVSGQVSALGWWASVPVGALATAVLVVNNLRDRETDRRAGKRTLAVLLGRRAMLGEYAALLGVSYLVPPWLVARGLATPWVLLPLLTAPLALGLFRRLRGEAGRALNAVLAETAQLLLGYGLLFALGIALGRR